MVHDVHRTPIGIWISDGNANGVLDGLLMGFSMNHINRVSHIKLWGRLIYPKEAKFMYHVNPKHAVYLSVSVRSVNLTAYSVSGTFTNFQLLTSAVQPDILVYCACQYHCM